MQLYVSINNKIFILYRFIIFVHRVHGMINVILVCCYFCCFSLLYFFTV